MNRRGFLGGLVAALIGVPAAKLLEVAKPAASAYPPPGRYRVEAISFDQLAQRITYRIVSVPVYHITEFVAAPLPAPSRGVP